MSNSDFALAESVSTTNVSLFIAIYILVLIYCCFALAIVCDVYFVPALQKLSITYDLPPDIAGSTLMALGASVPELFSSLIGVFVTEDDIGTGSIIGSSCFNLIAVPAACAFVAAASFDHKLTIKPIPVIRNSAFYATTILVLLLIIKDNKVDLVEALILLLFFVMYIAMMVVCANTAKSNKEANYHQHHQTSSSSLSSLTSSSTYGHDDHHVVYIQYHLPLAIQQGLLFEEKTKPTETTPLFAAVKGPNGNNTNSIGLGLGLGLGLGNNSNSNHKPQDKKDNTCWTESLWIVVPMLPLTLGMKLLTPLKFKNTCWTMWTFLVSIAIIGGLTYVSVWVVHLFSQTLGIPETVAGMTILSWGTGIPELIASIVLIRKTAQADMAICNTIGSNVIDVSFCLSLPWIVKCFINKAEGLGTEVDIQSAALPWTSFTLLVSLILLILILKLHNWQLSCSVGVWLTLTYFAFVGAATYLESSYATSGLDIFALV